MSDKDKELVEQVLALSYHDGCIWTIGDILMEQAESEEAKEIMRRHLAHEYHREEAMAGME